MSRNVRRFDAFRRTGRDFFFNTLDAGETKPGASLLSSNEPLVPSTGPVGGTSGSGAGGHKVCAGYCIASNASSPRAASAWPASCVSKA